MLVKTSADCAVKQISYETNRTCGILYTR